MRVINKKIEELDLPLVMDKVTQGCGNCFYYAIRQQVDWPELSQIKSMSKNPYSEVKKRNNKIAYLIS